MDEVVDQAIKTLAVGLILITLRICYDLGRTMITDRSRRSPSLLALFLAFLFVGLGAITAVYSLEIPFWMKFWMIITLGLAAGGAYFLLQEMK